MKNILTFCLSICLCFCLLLSLNKAKKQDVPSITASTTETDSSDKKENGYIKAVWLSQFDMYAVYTENGKQRKKESYEKLVKTITANIKSAGLNTVFVQLRPNGDSIYPSKIYPASRYAVGEYGRSHSYDPFAIFIEYAQKEELSVHGWINPLRCMSADALYTLDDEYEAVKLCKEGYAKEINGTYYLDPSFPESRRLICLGAQEILKKYPVDGIHIDDYFYPTTDKAFDSVSYAGYKSSNGRLSLEDYRRENINMLVKELYQTVKSEKSDALFGVSPSGNTERNYSTLYADTELWCSQKGYVDYICPQIYFGFEHSTCAFDSVCDEFEAMIKEDGISLIIGMTLNKAADSYDGIEDVYAGEGRREWIEEDDILLRSLEYAKKLDSFGGVAYFSYQFFFDPLSGEENRKTEKEREVFLPALSEI